MQKNKDELEKFIEQNKEAFNSDEPSSDLWNRVEDELDNKQLVKNSNAWGLVWKAAVIVMIASGVAYLLIDNQKIETEQQAKQESEAPAENQFHGKLREVSPEMAEVEHFYYTEIEKRLAEARALEVNEELLEQVEELDKEYEALQEELKKGMASERIIEAMIENYRTKLELLENILEEIKTQKEIIKKQKDENNNQLS